MENEPVSNSYKLDAAPVEAGLAERVATEPAFSAADELSEFASVMVDEVIARTRLQLDEGVSLSVEDQKHMLNQLIKERSRLAALRAPIERKGEGKAIYIWFSDIGNIRKWSFEPFENGRCYLPRYEPTWENPDGPTAA